jgi:predicted RNA-binding protein with EMAP domain
MRSSRSFPLVIAIAAFASAAEAAVIVTFKNPEHYAGVGWQRSDASATLNEIERHLQRLGESYLAPDQTLSIEVLDIDLAGRERFSSRAGGDVRVLRGGADWPSVRVRYVVETAGKVGDSREETVSDVNYLVRPIPRSEKLAYEKRMLEEWFRARFARP